MISPLSKIVNHLKRTGTPSQVPENTWFRKAKQPTKVFRLPLIRNIQLQFSWYSFFHILKDSPECTRRSLYKKISPYMHLFLLQNMLNTWVVLRPKLYTISEVSYLSLFLLLNRPLRPKKDYYSWITFQNELAYFVKPLLFVASSWTADPTSLLAELAKV